MQNPRRRGPSWGARSEEKGLEKPSSQAPRGDGSHSGLPEVPLAGPTAAQQSLESGEAPVLGASGPSWAMCDSETRADG